MSSRFDHLEFDPPPPGPKAVPNQGTNLDESYEAQARQAFESASFQRALQLYARILEFDRTSLVSWEGQIQCLIQLGRADEADRWASLALDEWPEHGELIALKAISLARTGHRDEALAFSDAALQGQERTALGWLARAEILILQNDTTADYCQEQALESSPKAWQIAWLTSRTRAHYNQFAVGLRLANIAIDRAPTHATPWLQAAHCQSALGLRKPAYASLARATEISPESPIVSELKRNLDQDRGITRFLKRWGLVSHTS